MANADRVLGFIPKLSRNGAPWNGRVVEGYFAAATGTACGIGDTVIIDGSTSSTDGTPGLQKAAATVGTVFGVVVGFRADPTNLNASGLVRAASTARYALVVPVADVVFEIQADGVGTSVGQVVGLFANTTDAGPSATTGLSGMEVISTTIGTTTTFPLMVVGTVQSEDNDATLANAKLLVTFNYPQGTFYPVQVSQA